jgi:putative transposase
MKDDTSIIPLRQPASVEDPLTEIAREGARRMLVTALEAEIEAFLDGVAEERLADGRQRVVRHGHGPERKVQTGIGALDLRRPKIRDRAADVASGEKIRFTSHILPKWARRSRSLDALLPVLYLRGISTGDFQEALSALLGQGRAEPVALGDRAPHGGVAGRNTSAGSGATSRPGATSMSGPTGSTCRRGWSPRRSACSSSSAPRRRAGRSCSASTSGCARARRAGASCWSTSRPAASPIAPELAVGDGALGFWKALEEVFPGTRHQRCWVHKVANVLNKVPKSVHGAEHEVRPARVWQADTRAAEAAMDTFAEKYGAKYDKAVACLTKDREALLAFFDFPPSTGTTCAPRTRSRASSPPSGTGPSGPRARSRRRPPS